MFHFALPFLNYITLPAIYTYKGTSVEEEDSSVVLLGGRRVRIPTEVLPEKLQQEAIALLDKRHNTNSASASERPETDDDSPVIDEDDKNVIFVDGILQVYTDDTIAGVWKLCVRIFF
jgi:hypothetical protein